MKPFTRLLARGLRNPVSFLVLLRRLPQVFKLTFRLMRDRRVSVFAKLILLLGVFYFLFPFDLLPDFLFPLVSYVDDFAVMVLCFRLFLKLCPADLVFSYAEAIQQEI